MTNSHNIPSILSTFVKTLSSDAISNVSPEINLTSISETLFKLTFTYNLANEVQQDDCKIRLIPAFTPSFHWMPHLTPNDANIMAEHIFRTPALIMRGEGKTLILTPDIEKTDNKPPLYLDLNAEKNIMTIGMANYKVTHHVLYERETGASYQAGQTSLSFYLMIYNEEIANPFRPPLEHLWSKYGTNDASKVTAETMEKYCEHTYTWAFDNWKDIVWQEFDFNGKRVGAPAFIVNVYQSPSYDKEFSERENRSIWNQSWFSSLRSASGLFRYAKRNGRADLMGYALKTKELALAFPQENGLFNSVVATKMTQKNIDGRDYWKSAGWDTLYVGNSDRNPFVRGLDRAPKHILDMSFTAYYMLIWYDELEKDSRLLTYAETYADRLIEIQQDNGFYPGWVDGNQNPMGVLDDSPESSMSVAFLMYLAKLTGKIKYADSAKKAMQSIMTEIIPTGRWEDYETYWSCCGYHNDHVGEKIKRNNIYKQCNFSMYFTALALMDSYVTTGDKSYLTTGTIVLDELLMTQSSYQPPQISIPVCGGFGVMNCDGELIDARQSLFSELIIKYGEATNTPEYTERGLAAMKISFSMMYCPENPEAKEQWEKVWPFFTPKDYGFTMENYGHTGIVDQNGIGIGEFTIYDWGNGAAAENYQRIVDHAREGT